MKIEQHLVPENIKGIAWKANPDNKISTQNEKIVALSQLEMIAEYCRLALDTFQPKKRT